MVRSMTGFGRAKLVTDDLTVTVEIKSVNHRFFDCTSRVPRTYAFLEDNLRNMCKQRISRGKIEISVMVEDNGNDSSVIEINRPYVDAYLKALKNLSNEYHIKNDISISSIISNQEVFTVKQKTISEETILKVVSDTADKALISFTEMSQNEGQKLLADVTSRLDFIIRKVEIVEEQSPRTVMLYREKLEQKMRELLEDKQIDEQRLLTETAIFADKIAVAEETVRLKSHINQFRELLNSSEPVGRKLDFIVQEMNREANTIGSKAQDIEIAHIVVDIKSEIEKIREQIQNIE